LYNLLLLATPRLGLLLLLLTSLGIGRSTWRVVSDDGTVLV
jgi:hypothetical protein